MAKTILRVYLIESIEAEGSLLVTNAERVIELTGATAKSGKSVVQLLFSPGHLCYLLSSSTGALA